MKKQSLLKTHEWEDLLTATQKIKYKNAINKGYFSTYHGYNWKYDSFYGAYIWKHPNRVAVLEIFTGILGHYPEWADLTDNNLRELFEAIKKRYAPNSARTFSAEICALIRQHDENAEIPSVKYAKILKGKRHPSQAIYLTSDEIKLIHEYYPLLPYKRRFKRLFMLECLTGARFSDCERLSTENLSDDGRTLVYIAQKTKIEVRVPVHRLVRQYLVKSPTEPSGKFALSLYNDTIREICCNCGIDDKVKIYSAGKEKVGEKWEFVSSHTGRRSFATNLAKKHVAIEQIALMMGHISGNVPNIAMTQRYIVDKLTLDPKVFQIFGTDEDF